MEVHLLSWVKGDGTCPYIYKYVQELLGIIILVKKNYNSSCVTTSTAVITTVGSGTMRDYPSSACLQS